MRILIASLLLTAGCAGKPVEVQKEIVRVAVPASCPVKSEYDQLKAGRPKPLRETPMPASPEERVGRNAAQLGLYEKEGGWADRVMAALDRCQLQ